jgi:hypothetical protein
MQCIVPGILTITREEDPDDMPEFINARCMPRPQWLLKNRTQLEMIFDEDGFEELMEAASDKRRAYNCTQIPRMSEEEMEEMAVAEKYFERFGESID